MAKAKGPLMSIEASGSIKKTLTFSTWKGRNVVKNTPHPHNPKTDAQMGIRANFTGVVAAYKALSSPMKTLWVTEGDRTQITGLNAMMRVAQHNLQALKGIQQQPTTSSTTPPAAPTALAGAVSGEQVILSWTPSVTANAYQTYLYRSDTTGFTPGPTTLIKVVPQTVAQAMDTPGIGTWYYVVACDSDDGYLSDPSTEITIDVTG